MWSLPDINQMNASKAAVAASGNDYIKQARSPSKHTCDHCDKQAEYGEVAYDIFSEDPSQVDFACEEHHDWMDENTFICESCNRRMIDHITWERYQVDGVCLRCAAREHFADPENWIDPAKVKVVTLEPKEQYLHKGGVLNVAKTPHVLGVKQPLPEGIEFVDNFEFDAMDGHQISGGDMLEAIQKLDRPFTVVLDAAYQFAVSIGIYQRKLTDGQKVAQVVRAAATAGHFG